MANTQTIVLKDKPQTVNNRQLPGGSEMTQLEMEGPFIFPPMGRDYSEFQVEMYKGQEVVGLENCTQVKMGHET